MRSIFGVLFAVGFAQASFGLTQSGGQLMVQAMRAIHESGGQITSQALLTEATNKNVGAVFSLAKGALANKGSVDITDWEALETNAAKYTAEEVSAKFSGVKKLTQQNAITALAASKTARKVAQPQQTVVASSFSCPAGATDCQTFLVENEIAKQGKAKGATISAQQAEAQLAALAQVVNEVNSKAGTAACGNNAACKTNLINGAARVLKTFGTLSVQFVSDMVHARGQFEGFTNIAQLAVGYYNAAVLGKGMGAPLEGCILRNAAPAMAN